MVKSDGQFGFMPVYGADNFTDNVNGVSGGEEITLVVNGEVAEETVTWTTNGDRIEITNLTTAGKNTILPSTYSLAQNYPNPFNPETTIDFIVGKAGNVEIAIYNVLGEKIKTLLNEYRGQGNYSVKWYGDTDQGAAAASGVYFYKLTSGAFSEVKKMTLLK